MTFDDIAAIFTQLFGVYTQIDVPHLAVLPGSVFFAPNASFRASYAAESHRFREWVF